MIDLNKMSDIEKVSKIWQIQLNMEYTKPQKNVRISFKDIGAFFEYLALDFLPDYQGGGSGGMGFDLYNKKTKKAIEVKSCCTIQNGKCCKCSTKFNDLFLSTCPDCGSNKIKRMNDSRFGINAHETLRQYEKNIFEEFILGYLSEKNHFKDKHVLEISIEWFKINFDSDKTIKKIKLDYFINQNEFGKKKLNNLVPYSFDFYKLVPLKINETTIKIDYANLNNKPIVTNKTVNYYPRVDGDKLKLKGIEKKMFINLKTYDKKTNTADAVDFTLNIPYRNKNLGKERGDTRINLDKALKNKVDY